MNDVIQYTANLILTAFIAAYIVHGTGDAVVAAFSKRRALLTAYLLELRIGRLARRLRWLRKVQANSMVAVGDMMMALAVMTMGGGYLLFLLIVAGFAHLGHQSVQPALISMVGAMAILFSGLWRASESCSDMTSNGPRLQRVLALAKARGWDIEDACAALSDR
ncbi:hypothetical protein CFHF_18060 [Caulobacter flavus]|jgi:hypothetical protein|uniref:Peptidase n=1 Tax=Caulobacter flavus TaxID=1679497 RepID=A0A2N5CQA8_9CAUL|nr:hypothetical protein [Caulobacter flavus]AYV46273.1 hypothetical protein C1707_08395 [Caulobacter flavus]PLR09993.1 hypothetical protein CFHF_18060 [Caulobacter flavus]